MEVNTIVRILSKNVVRDTGQKRKEMVQWYNFKNVVGDWEKNMELGRTGSKGGQTLFRYSRPFPIRTCY